MAADEIREFVARGAGTAHTDQGGVVDCGIPTEAQGRIFDLFYSGGSSEGSGIGLAVVKRIVDLHQGRIVVESETGAGTTFQVLLPLAPDREEGSG